MTNRRFLSDLPLGLAVLASAILLTACGGKTGNEAVGNDAAVTGNMASNVETIEDTDALDGPTGQSAALPTDDWVGRWTGPEGLFLDIQPSPDGKPGHYAITNKDTLDRQDNYAGVAQGATIRIVRDGKDVTIHPGAGTDTGFKYLSDKQECLILQPGVEGYCR